MPIDSAGKKLMYRLEHIGIAVKSLAHSDELYHRLTGTSSYKHEVVEEQKVTTSFFQAGSSKIELLESTDPDSAIQKFIDRKGEGLHHLAFEVDDIRLEMIRLKEQGFQLLQDEPSVGADNKWVCFIHPRSVDGVLIEICQTIPEDTRLHD